MVNGEWRIVDGGAWPEKFNLSGESVADHCKLTNDATQSSLDSVVDINCERRGLTNRTSSCTSPFGATADQRVRGLKDPD